MRLEQGSLYLVLFVCPNLTKLIVDYKYQSIFLCYICTYRII
jgi:hypothetical protein